MLAMPFRRQIAAWFVLIGVVMLAREACLLYGARVMWIDGWLHIGRGHVPQVMQVLAALALPFAAGFVFVGLRFNALIEEGSELPLLVASLGAGRALVQVLVERSLGYEVSWAPLVGMAFLAWQLRRSVHKAVLVFPDATPSDPRPTV